MKEQQEEKHDFNIDDAQEVLAILEQRITFLENVLKNHEHVNGQVYTKL